MMVLSSSRASLEKSAWTVPIGRKPACRPDTASARATKSAYMARLALPSSTAAIIPGFSGAGDKIPAPAQEASRPSSCRSNIEWLRRFNQLFGKHLRLLGEAARPAPIPAFGGLARVFDEAANLGRDISLHGIELLSGHASQIFFRFTEAGICFQLRGGGFLGGHLRRDDRGRGQSSLGFRCWSR